MDDEYNPLTDIQLIELKIQSLEIKTELLRDSYDRIVKMISKDLSDLGGHLDMTRIIQDDFNRKLLERIEELEQRINTRE